MKNEAATVIILVAVSAVIACSPEHPIKSVYLEVHANGGLTLEGKIVKPTELKDALGALITPNSKLCVAVTPAEPIPDSDLQAARREVQKAGISCVGSLEVISH
jgi:biopolymer transport protein ExbD